MANYVDKFEIGNDEILINGMYTLPRQRKFLVIGDSYSTLSNSWSTRFKNILEIPNANYSLSHITGAGFTVANNEKKFITLLENANITDKDLITDIIVCGGYNDMSSTHEAITTAIQLFMTRAKQLFINAQVYIGFISWSTRPAEYGDLAVVRNAYGKAMLYGAKYLNGVEYAMHKSNSLFTDAVHPNANGQERIANAVIQAYLTGSYIETEILNNVSLVNVNSNITGLGNNFIIYLSGDTTIVDFKTRGFIYFTEPYESGFIDVGEFENTYVFGILESNAPTFDVKLPIRYSDNTLDEATVEFRIVRSNDYNTNSKLQMRIINLNQAVNRFTIYPTKFILNTMLQR